MILTRPHLKHPPTCARRFYAGDPGYVNLGKPAALNFANNSPFSVELWANPWGSVANQIVFGGGYDGATAYQFSTGGGSTYIGSYNGSVHQAQVALDIPLNTWTHLYGDYDGAAWHVSIGGVLQATSVDAIGPIARPEKASIGMIYNTGSPSAGFQGAVARVTVRNVALQPAEVAALANGASPATVRRGAGLVYWWQPSTVLGPDIDLIGGNIGTVVVGAAAGSFLIPFTARGPVVKRRTYFAAGAAPPAVSLDMWHQPASQPYRVRAEMIPY